jgi:hypothetical protein
MMMQQQAALLLHHHLQQQQQQQQHQVTAAELPPQHLQQAASQAGVVAGSYPQVVYAQQHGQVVYALQHWPGSAQPLTMVATEADGAAQSNSTAAVPAVSTTDPTMDRGSSQESPTAAAGDSDAVHASPANAGNA